METATATADVTVHDGGTIFMFELNTEAARAWVQENVSLEAWQWMGDAFVVEHRYAGGLAEGMIEHGLRVE